MRGRSEERREQERGRDCVWMGGCLRVCCRQWEVRDGRVDHSAASKEHPRDHFPSNLSPRGKAEPAGDKYLISL